MFFSTPSGRYDNGKDQRDLLEFRIFLSFTQALCKRTLNIVEALSEKHCERMRFYLTKADEAGHESDRQRVMMQIVQELCKRPTLNRTGFDMPTIFIPNPDKVRKPSKGRKLSTGHLNQFSGIFVALNFHINESGDYGVGKLPQCQNDAHY